MVPSRNFTVRSPLFEATTDPAVWAPNGLMSELAKGKRYPQAKCKMEQIRAGCGACFVPDSGKEPFSSCLTRHMQISPDHLRPGLLKVVQNPT